jgi:hypothetical protein
VLDILLTSLGSADGSGQQYQGIESRAFPVNWLRALKRSVIATSLDALEPTLACHGYNARAVAELLHVRQVEIRALLRGRLPVGRVQELQQELRAAGLPIYAGHYRARGARGYCYRAVVVACAPSRGAVLS